MSKPVLVWNYSSFFKCGKDGFVQCLCITTAKTLTELARATGESRSYLADYSSETGNAEQIALAMSDQTKIFYKSLRTQYQKNSKWFSVYKAKDK